MPSPTQSNLPSDLLHHINLQLIGGPGCPGAGALGECAALDCNASGVWSAYIYLWPAGHDLKPSVIASWFTDKGVELGDVCAVLFDPDNEVDDGQTPDGARPLVVTFTLRPMQEA